MRQRAQRVLVEGGGLTIGRARHRALARVAQIADGGGPGLRPQRMVGEPLDVLGAALAGIAGLERRDDARVQRAALLFQQRGVGDLLGDRVLERVGEIGHQRARPHEVGGLELRERVQHLLGRGVGHRLQQRHRHIDADGRAGLQDRLALARQSVDARGQHGLHAIGDLQALHESAEAILPALTGERVRLGARAAPSRPRACAPRRALRRDLRRARASPSPPTPDSRPRGATARDGFRPAAARARP